MDVNVRNPNRLFIDGQWVESQDGAPIEVISPNTEQVAFTVAGAGPKDMDRAVAAARKAFDKGDWSLAPASVRIDAVERLAQALERRTDELSAAWTQQMGALPALAPFLVTQGTQNLFNAVAVGRKFRFEEKTESPVAPNARIVHDPIGVVAAITPWNVPYMLMTTKIGPALIAGCTVVMKPSPETPIEAYIIAECAEEVGIPAGVINLVPSEREAADHLVRNPDIDKVAFTGSTAVGRHIA